MSKSIKLHKEYGLNPTVLKCYICGEDTNEIALLGSAYKEQAPMYMVIDKTPCKKCIEYIKQGIILIGVCDGENGENPYRTGQFYVIKEEAFKKVLGEVPEGRICFVEESALKKIGLDNQK